jgi:hypothetical protein
MSSDVLSLFQNLDRMDDARTQISHLIERLDNNTNLDEVESLVTGMGGLLGNFMLHHESMQSEMKDLLESSRSGLLTHAQLVDVSRKPRSQPLITI